MVSYAFQLCCSDPKVAILNYVDNVKVKKKKKKKVDILEIMGPKTKQKCMT